jgi:hypothetical protein|tara:strand:+ start:994 stop:1596 length:603 start_codon:yes stop_codon:yes gene_type:complete
MPETPFMPKATAVWLVENTTLTFKQIAIFCNLHELEVKGIADGDVAKGIKAYNPILAGQLTRDEIDVCSKDSNKNLNLIERAEEVQVKERKKPKYTPLSKRQDRPDAALWLLKNYSEFTDGQISKLVGSTKGTVSLIRKRSYWNFSNLKAKDPVILGLCSQDVFEKSLEKAKKRVEREKKAKVKADKLKTELETSTKPSS